MSNNPFRRRRRKWAEATKEVPTARLMCRCRCGWAIDCVTWSTVYWLEAEGCPDCGGPVSVAGAFGPPSTSNHPSAESVDTSTKSERTPRRGSAHAKGESTSDD